MAESLAPSVGRLRLADIAAALQEGRQQFLAAPRISITYAAVFTAVGLILLGALVVFGLSPMILPFAGGFMLVGPVLIAGYFALSNRILADENPTLVDVFRALRSAPAGLWAVALICAFLFVVWITDAGILYGFLIGGTQVPFAWAWTAEYRDLVLPFEFWASLMGSVLAYMIFAISAFSVPLIYDRRAGAIQAIHTSVNAVLKNFWVCLAWGVLLSAVIILSILLLPLLLITLPVMSYASYALYRRSFVSAAGASS